MCREQMCTCFLESSFRFGILLLYTSTLTLWNAFFIKSREKVTAAAMNVTTASRCQAAHIHQIHTAMPKHAFRGKKKQEKKHWLESAGPLTRALLRSAWFQLRRILFCSSSPPVVLRKVLAKWKRGSGFSAVLYAAVHCEINELSLTLEFLQPAFWKGQRCDIATLLICRSESGYIDQIAF